MTIGRTKPFAVDSHVVRLSAAAARTVSLGFSRKQLGELRPAARRTRRITATVRGVLLDSAVYGVIHDPTGSIAQQTGGQVAHDHGLTSRRLNTDGRRSSDLGGSVRRALRREPLRVS